VEDGAAGSTEVRGLRKSRNFRDFPGRDKRQMGFLGSASPSSPPSRAGARESYRQRCDPRKDPLEIRGDKLKRGSAQGLGSPSGRGTADGGHRRLDDGPTLYEESPFEETDPDHGTRRHRLPRMRGHSPGPRSRADGRQHLRVLPLRALSPRGRTGSPERLLADGRVRIGCLGTRRGLPPLTRGGRVAPSLTERTPLSAAEPPPVEPCRGSRKTTSVTKL
jgi:hypothetical protein